MSKGGEKEQQGPDLDGRIMALEQQTRGLNARLCAIERSISADPNQCHNIKPFQGADGNTLSTGTIDEDDFVPASMTTSGLQRSAEPVTKGNSEVAASRGTGKPHWLRMGTLDITGLIAGTIMVIISILLFTDNVELLKNPLMPLTSGILLIGTVCVRKYLR